MGGIRSGPRRTDAACSIRECAGIVVARGYCRKHYLRWHRHGSPETILVNRVASGVAHKWFIDHIDHPDTPECLIWPFNRPDGRAQIWWNGTNQLASRVMCEIVNGQAPSHEHHAAHSCGKAYDGCIHPKHLRWATPKENEADKLLHGTRARGESHGMAKLTEADIPLIRAACGTLYEIGDRFGIHYSTAGLIRSRKIWKHVP